MGYCAISNKTRIQPAGSLTLGEERKLNKTNVFLSESHSFHYLKKKEQEKKKNNAIMASQEQI